MSASEQNQKLLRLEQLYEVHHHAVLGLAFNLLHDREDAQEVAQDVFLAAWRSEATYNPARGSVRTWLLSIVRHRCIDHLRARARQARSQAADGANLTNAHDALSPALEAADAAAVLAMLGGVLPLEQWQAVELAYFHDLSQSEIASLLEIPLGTVKGRMRAALTRLRVVLSPADVAVA